VSIKSSGVSIKSSEGVNKKLLGCQQKVKENIILNTKGNIIEDKEDRCATFSHKAFSFSSTEYPIYDLTEFIDYWTESSENGKKMRFEKEKVFDIKRRLNTWMRNKEKFGNKNVPDYLKV
jgi:hypothetical protein